MADTLIIANGKVSLKTEEGQTIERPEADLCAMFLRESRAPIDGLALPDGVKFLRWSEPYLLVVHQHPPFCRSLRWIANDSPVDFGPGTKYRKVRLSMPYAITFALYYQRGEQLFLTSYNELYFRNEPLRSKSDLLCYPALLNVSIIKTPKRLRSWICTQHLHNTPSMDWTAQLGNLVTHTWDGAFNRSSERHEGLSSWGFSQGIHPDLHPVERWEQASKQDDAFALSLPWKPALTVGELMDCLLEEIDRQSYSIHSVVPRRSSPTSIVQRYLNFVQQNPATAAT